MNIAIAGAGLLGRLLAWRLLRAGHRVTLFDRDRPDGELAAGRVAAAMLAPYSEVVACEREIFDWGRESQALWPGLLAELQEDGGGEVYFQQRGSVVVAHAADRGMLHHFNHLLRSRIPDHLERVRFVDRAGLRELEPELADHFGEATFLADEGTLDNRELLAGLHRVILARGGRWHDGVEVISVRSGAVELAGETVQCDLAIDARGAGARGEMDGLRGVRGEVLWVHAPEVKLSRPVRLMHPRYQLYVSPKRGDVYVIGATEIESESLAPVTVRSSLELLSALYSLHSGFSEAQVIHAYTNLRPAFFDNLPRIDREPGLLRVNGLYRHGYLLGPWLMRRALAALEEEQ